MLLDAGYAGYPPLPSNLIKAYIEEKIKYSDAVTQNKQTTDYLFCTMTNFEAIHHGWYTEGDLVPSSSLDLEISRDLVEPLNPTAKDFHMIATIDQCTSTKAR